MNNYVNGAKLDEFAKKMNAKQKTIFDHRYMVKGGVCGIARADNSSNQHYLFYSEDGVNFDFLLALDQRISSDASQVTKIGNYYYYTGNTTYQISTDLVNWSTDYFIDAVQPISGGYVWGSMLFVDPSTGKIWIFCSVQYKTGIVPLSGTGATTTEFYFRIDAYEMVQQSDGRLTKVTNEPTTIIGGNGTDSYIDPFMIYNNEFGYIFAVKNVIQSKIEIYNGNTLTGLERVTIADNLVGVEAPQLVQTSMGDVIMYVHAYEPKTISAHEDYEAALLSANKLPAEIYYTRLTYSHSQKSGRTNSFANMLLWNIAKFPTLVRHPGFMMCGGTERSILLKYDRILISDAEEGRVTYRLINNELSGHNLVFTNAPVEYATFYSISDSEDIGTINCSYKRIFENPTPVYIVGHTSKRLIDTAVLKIGSGMSGYSESVDKKIDLTYLQDSGVMVAFATTNNFSAPITGMSDTGTITAIEGIGGTLDSTTCVKLNGVVTVSGRIHGISLSGVGRDYFNVPEGFRPAKNIFCYGYMMVDNDFKPILASINTNGNVSLAYSANATVTQVGFSASYGL